MPPSLPTPATFDVKPALKLPAHIRAIVNLPPAESSSGKAAVRDNAPTKPKAIASPARVPPGHDRPIL